MQIYLARNNVQAGPYTLDELNQMLGTGDVDLTDLMWHEGMANWQPVGEVTHNNRQYLPNVITRLPNPNSDTAQQADTANTAKDTGWLTKLPTTIIPTKTTGIDIAHAKKEIELASRGSRIIAKIIDVGLFILTMLPLYFSVVHSPNFDKIMEIARTGDNAEVNRQMALLVLPSIPLNLIVITYLMIFAILFAQIVLSVRRGQTIGKMAMGIRMLDKQSNAMPTFFNGILLRSLPLVLLFLIMYITHKGIVDSSILATYMNFLLLYFFADFIAMLINSNRDSLHDKLASTYVVRADDTQTTPLALEPSE